MTAGEHSLEALFEELMDQPPVARAAFYEAEGVDAGLVSLLEELLEAHGAADFEMPTAPSLADLEEVATSDEVGAVLEGRYRLDAVLGGGAFGTVYRAHDLIEGEAVAVKVPSIAPLSHAALEREAACLRRLEFGVARLRDQGVFGDAKSDERHYLVYDLIEGQPFPGSTPPREALFSLLASLSAVHARGVVHRDLKPANVLVTEEGAAFLVDFGIAHGPAFAGEGTSRDLSVGTVAFAAPEQLAGEMGDARSDVFSWALMGLNGLTGASPTELRAAPQCPPAIHSADRALCQELHRIVSGSRSQRPRNACEVEQSLVAESATESLAVRTGVHDDALLRVLERALAEATDRASLAQLLEPAFSGLEPLHHLRSGAAAEFARRIDGQGQDVGAAARLLGEWIERGVAFWNGDRVELHAVGLEALRGDPLDAEQDHGAIAASGGDLAWVSGMLEEANRLERRGFEARATSILVRALARVRTWPSGAAAAEYRILPLLIRLAVQDGTNRPLDHAAFELARSRVRGAARASLDFALEVARASAAGDDERATRETRPMGLLPDDDVLRLGGGDGGEGEWARLEACVLSVQYRGSLGLPLERGQVVRRAAAQRVRALSRRHARPEPSVHGPLHSRRFTWLAFRCYRRGRFARAAALHRLTAQATESNHDQSSALLNAASSAMEAWDFDGAYRDAAEALRLIEEAPFPVLEARAVWTLRSLALRGGGGPPPDPELDEAFDALGSVRLQALYALTESAIARVAGDRERWVEFAGASFAAWQLLNQGEAAALARSLMIAGGSPPVPGDEEVFSSLSAATDPGVALQVLALAPQARRQCAGYLEGWAAGFQRVPRGCRLDALNVAEIETVLGIAGLGDH